MQSLVIAIQVTVEYFYDAVYFLTSRFTLQFNSMDSCDSFYAFKCRQDLKEEIQNDRKSYDSKINEILGKHLSRIQHKMISNFSCKFQYVLGGNQKIVLIYKSSCLKVTLTTQSHLNVLVQEPRAVYLKWMSTSGNEFEERKMFLVCENLILKKNPLSQC